MADTTRQTQDHRQDKTRQDKQMPSDNTRDETRKTTQRNTRTRAHRSILLGMFVWKEGRKEDSNGNGIISDLNLVSFGL
jgi:hypothetical protein